MVAWIGRGRMASSGGGRGGCRRRTTAFAVAAGLLLSACGGASTGRDEEVASDEVRVVATTTIMGDLVHTVVDDAGSVEVLMAPGADPHTFALSARQRASLGDADLVVANGLGLEAGMQDVLDAVAADGVAVVEVAPELDPLALDDDAHDDHAGEDDHTDPASEDEHDSGGFDPHVWLDPSRMGAAGEVVATALDDVAEGPWHEGAAAWEQAMQQADAAAEAALSEVPEQCRVLVTNHDALATFADRYGLTVVGTIVPGLSTDAAPSAGDLAALTEVVEDTGVTTIFVEDTATTRAADALAREIGDVDVVAVPVATVGGDGPATLADLVVELADTVADGLRDCA